MFFFFFFN